MSFTKGRLKKIWNKGGRIKGKDPELYRKDIYGNTMFKPSYGQSGGMGWNVDHAKPQSKGGTNNISNLQPMNTVANTKKGNKY